MFDPHPAVDQGIEHVFDRLQRRQGCHLRWLGDELRDAADLGVKSGVDRSELIEQPFDSRSRWCERSAFQYFPVSDSPCKEPCSRAQAVPQRDMGKDHIRAGNGVGTAGGVQLVAKSGESSRS